MVAPPGEALVDDLLEQGLGAAEVVSDGGQAHAGGFGDVAGGGAGVASGRDTLRCATQQRLTVSRTHNPDSTLNWDRCARQVCETFV